MSQQSSYKNTCKT